MASIDTILIENNMMLKNICKKLDICTNTKVKEVKTYLRGDELKKEIQRLTENGMSKRNIAEQLNISVATVSNYRRQIKQEETALILEDIDTTNIFDDKLI